MEIEYNGEYLTMRGDGSHRQIRLNQDQMIDICAAFAKWNREQNTERTKDWPPVSSENGGYVVKWARMGQHHRSRYDTFEEAIKFAWHGEETDQMTVLYITCPDDSIIRDEALYQELKAYEISRSRRDDKR